MFQNVAIVNIVPSPTNPRRIGNPNIEELAESVRKVGVLEPLLVRPNGKTGVFELVAGERRLRAAKAAKLDVVPVRVLELTDEQAIEVQIVENLQRQDVHPLDEAAGFAVLLERTKLDVAAIAAKVGKSESYVRQRLQLQKLSPKVAKAFADGKLNAAHAMHLARIPAKVQDQVFEQEFRYVEPTAAALGQEIQRRYFMDLHGAPWKKDDAALLPSVGACTTCPKRTGFSPALFPDIAKKDTCTDGTCFNTKLEAHIERQRTSLKEQGEKVVEVSTDWSGGKAKGGAIDASSYRRLEKGDKQCASAATGLVVDGYGGERGKVIKVCADKGCKVHHGSRSTGVDQSWKKRQAAAAAKAKVESQVRQRVFEAIFKKPAATIQRVLVLRVIVVGLFREVWAENQEKIFRLEGWAEEPKKGKPHAYQRDRSKAFAARVEKLGEAELRLLILKIGLVRDVAGGQYTSEDDALLKVAKLVGVDVGAIRRELATAPKKKKAKQRPVPSRTKRASA